MIDINKNMNEIKRLQQLAGINEIKLNKPGEINIMADKIDDDVDFWVDEDKVIKYLYPKYSNDIEDIRNYVEEINDSHPDSFGDITLKELIEDFKMYLDNK